MYLIVGLGNPEPEYNNTRHNMGFDVINILAKEYNIDINKSGFKSLYGTGVIEGEKVILCKPQTFMNLSGEAISEISDFYKISNDNIIVVYDDIDIKPGKIRVRKKGSAGGHNGMKSVVNHLGTIEFKRVRIGIGKPKYEHDLINYVLNKVEKEERELLDKGIENGKESIIEILKNGIDSAMNLKK